MNSSKSNNSMETSKTPTNVDLDEKNNLDEESGESSKSAQLTPIIWGGLSLVMMIYSYISMIGHPFPFFHKIFLIGSSITFLICLFILLVMQIKERLTK